MKIISMQATFGCLDHEKMTFQDGLNVLTMPNEAGKSTWCAFLLAMLYGVDSSERAKAGYLPVKTKYKPWSGAAMEGSMELEWQGRKITVERSSSGRGIMNEFHAYETESGLRVPELTAENCGVLLLGVERSVFERSAFIRQTGISVTPDATLEKRLHALVTTGEDTVSYSEAEHVLTSRKNYLGRARTGLLPKAQQELTELRRQESMLEDLSAADYHLREEQQGLLQAQQKLQQELEKMQQEQRLLQQQHLQQAQHEAVQKREQLDAARKAVEKLPDRDETRLLQQSLLELPGFPGRQPEQPARPVIPAAFQSMEEAQIRAMVEADLAAFDAAEQQTSKLMLPMLCALIAAICGVALLFVLLPLGMALIAGGLLLALWTTRRQRANAEQERSRLKARTDIQCKYGATERSQIQAQADACCTALAVYAAQCRQYESELAEFQVAKRQYEQKHEAFFNRLPSWTEAKNLEEAAAFLQNAALQHEAVEHAQAASAAAESYLKGLQAAGGDTALPLQDGKQNASSLLLRQMDGIQNRLQLVQSQLDRNQGQRSAIGDADALHAGIEALEERCSLLETHIRAIDLALEAMQHANSAVQARFSPALAKLASERLAFLTEGRYDKLLLETNFAAAARRTGDNLQHEQAYLSTGTADQIYLAVRLAICTMTLPKDTPLIADDALVFFDDARCRQALQLLLEEAATRQILLFTCQEREKNFQTDCQKIWVDVGR